MVRFAEVFTDFEIAQSLPAQLSWTHLVEIIRIDDPLKREFYTEMCRIENWSTRTLEAKIASMLFERTALSKKPDQLIRQELKALRVEDKLTPDLVFRDPYFLDFLGMKDTYAEKDLEAAILREMEAFILELGVGFAFLERQKRITVDGVDHYLDLLFYHRNLRRLVAVELKLGDFKPGDKGQMELYLGWLDRYERKEGETPPHRAHSLCREAAGDSGTTKLRALRHKGLSVLDRGLVENRDGAEAARGGAPRPRPHQTCPAVAAKRVGGIHNPKSNIQNPIHPANPVKLTRFRSPYGLLPAVFLRYASILSKIHPKFKIQNPKLIFRLNVTRQQTFRFLLNLKNSLVSTSRPTP